MTRYVIDPEVALMLAARRARIPAQHRLLAPTLLRSQVLAQLFVEVQRGALTRDEAGRQLDYLRAAQLRLLGDRVLQHHAWKIAADLKWPDTFIAEYVALTRLQADALVMRNPALVPGAEAFVRLATVDELLALR